MLSNCEFALWALLHGKCRELGCTPAHLGCQDRAYNRAAASHYCMLLPETRLQARTVAREATI